MDTPLNTDRLIMTIRAFKRRTRPGLDGDAIRERYCVCVIFFAIYKSISYAPAASTGNFRTDTRFRRPRRRP